ASGGSITLTPAFDRKYHDKIAMFTVDLRIRVPDAQAAHIVSVARATFGKSEQFRVDNAVLQNNQARDAIGVMTAALWIFAAVAPAAGLFVIGVVAIRTIAVGRADQPPLRAIGATRTQRTIALVVAAAAGAVAGALLAIAGAIALSP